MRWTKSLALAGVFAAAAWLAAWALQSTAPGPSVSESRVVPLVLRETAILVRPYRISFAGATRHRLAVPMPAAKSEQR